MKHVTDKIQAWLGGDLAPAEADDFAAHLQVCDDCAAEAQQARQMWDLLGTVADPVPADTPSVWEAVRAETLDSEASAGWFSDSGRLLRGSLATGALAAGLALGVLLPWGGAFPDDVGGSAFAAADDLETYWLTDTSWGASADGYGLAQAWFSEAESDEGNGS